MKCTINTRLLTVKAHYFFFFAAISCLMPFLPVYLLELGLRKSAVAIIYMVLPMSVILVKPIFGGIADRFRCHKIIFVGSLITAGISYFCIALVPTLKLHLVETTNITCGVDLSSTSTSNLSSSTFLVLCCPECKNYKEITCSFVSKEENTSDVLDYNVIFSRVNSSAEENGVGCSSVPLPNRTNCNLLENSTYNCKGEDGDKETWGFVHLLICMICSYMSIGVNISIGDMLAYQLSVEENSQFGYQRVWGSIGWGMLALIVSFVLEVTGIKNYDKGINPIFFIFISVCVVDVAIGMNFRIGKLPKPVKALKSLVKIFSDPFVILFSSAVFVVGFMTGALWTFLFVYVGELGGTPILFGLIIAVQCFIGEIPFLLLADRILNRIGHSKAIFISLCGFAVRYIGYSLIVDPWTILVLELLNGICFGLFFAALVSFAATSAPPGMAATMQGIEQTIFEGFGVGVGNLVSGFVYESIGGRKMYFCFGIVTAIFCVIYLIIHCLIHRLKGAPTQEENLEGN